MLTSNRKTALIVGSSDGIGLRIAAMLCEQGWQVAGLSRSKSDLALPGYIHYVSDVRDSSYKEVIQSILDDCFVDCCIYCAGVGEEIDLLHLENETNTFEVNLMGAVKCAELVIPQMVKAGRGHFVSLSSLADILVSKDSPSYSASKAGLSSYMNGLGLKAREHGVFVTNIRFGFVDTKMAKSKVRPFMITPEIAAKKVLRCLETRPMQYSSPKRMLAIVWFLSWLTNLAVWFK